MPTYVHFFLKHKVDLVTGEEKWKCSLCGLIVDNYTEDKEKYSRWDEEITQGGCTIDRETLSEESGLRPFVRE